MQVTGKLSFESFQNAKLRSVEFCWLDSEENEIAQVVFAAEFAQMLKNSPHICSTNKMHYIFDKNGNSCSNENYDLYKTRFAPILEHNCLKKNLETLKNENYEVRGFLVSEAVGTRFAENPSSCYTMLKANVDVLISCLLSEH